MKKKLLFIFGIIACWMTSHAQVPEYLYYKFNDSTSVHNYASNPQGNQNIPIPPDLFVDTVGMQGTTCLSGIGDTASGGINTGFYPDYSHSFTISFWFYDTTHVSGSNYKYRYLFGDSLANFHCYASIGSAYSAIGFSGGVIESQTIGFAATAQPNIVFIVYNATPTASAPYGRLTLYVNGNSLFGTQNVTKDLGAVSSGLVIGSCPGNAPNLSSSIYLNTNLGGNLDEFRWYNRALTQTEIQNTSSNDLLAIGGCSNYTQFKIDSISGDAARISWLPGTNNNSFSLEYGPSGFTPGSGTQVTNTYPGTQPPVLITGLSPQTEYDVYFKEYCSGGTDSIYNPNPQTFETTNSCPTPTNIQFLSVTKDSIELTWNHYGPAQDYYITYGPSGFDTATTGITDTVTSLPYKVGGLAPETIYDFYVSTACGGTYGKSIAVKRSMMTDCGIKTAPYVVDFEDSTWGAPPYPGFSGASDTASPCWTRNEGGYDWEVMKGALASMNNNHFLGTGGMYPNITYNYGDQAVIYSPEISLDSLTNPYLSFDYYRQFIPSIDEHVGPFYTRIQPDLYIDINDGTGWQTLKKISGYDQFNESITQLSNYANIAYPAPDPFKKIGFDLSSYHDTIQIRFRAENILGMGYYSGITAIDNFSVDEAPACPYIFGVNTQSFQADSSVVLNIQSEASSYTMEWGPKGFSQGTGCFATKSQPYTLDSCIAFNQEMDIYLQDCNGDWQGPFSFCGPYTAPYFNDFDQITMNPGDDGIIRSPECWGIYASGKQSAGDLAKIFPDQSFNETPRNNKLELYNFNVTPNDTLIAITPAFIDLPLGNKQIRFKAKVVQGNSISHGNTLEIGTMSNPKDGSTFHTIQSINLQYNKWKEYIVNLDPSNSSYNGTDIYIALKAGAGIKVTQIDDFHYEEVPTCQAPFSTSLSIKGVTFDGATISWNSITTSPTILAYGPSGFDPANSGQQATSLIDTFYNLSGLSAATTYDVYLRDSCGANDYSSWVGPITFTTYCTPFTAPFAEDFDGPSWIPAPPQDPYALGFGNYSNIHDTLDPCWRRNVRSGTPRYGNAPDSITSYLEIQHTWGVTANYAGGAANSTIISGPVSDHSGSGNYVFSIPRRSSSLAGKKEDIGDLYSPFIDISSLNHPYLSYYYHRFGNSMIPDFWIEINDGTGWDTVQYYSGPEITQNSKTAPFYKAGVDLSNFGDTIQIRFRSLYQYGANGSQGLTALDNIEVKEAPPCITPGNLSASYYLKSSIGNWSTTVTWDSSASLVNGYQVIIGKPGFNADSLANLGQAINLGNTDSLVVDTLTPGGCYEFAVRSICVSGDTSSFSSHYAFCLPCIEQAPILENFDLLSSIERFDPALIPNTYPCWHFTSFQQNGSTSGYKWDIGTGNNPLNSTGPLHDATGNGQYLYTNTASGINGDSAMLYSPVIDIQSLSKPEISFAYHMYGADIEALHLDLFDGVQWYTNVLLLSGQQQSSVSDPWKDTIIKLNNYSTTGFIQARLWSKRQGYDGYVSIDNFRISDTLACPFPTQFLMAGNTDSTATLSWVSDTSSQGFIIEYGPEGFGYGNGTQVTTSLDSLVLSANDNRIYQAYLTSACNSGDTSLYIGPVNYYSKTTPCDNMEAYDTGAVKNQSTLFKPWDGGALPTPYSWKGEEEFSSKNALSGTKSIHLSENSTNNGSSVLAKFDELSSDIHSVDFSFAVTDTGGGFYELLHGFNSSGYAQGASAAFYLNQVKKICKVWRNGTNDTIGDFPYQNGWNSIKHIIDFDNDTAWIELNGANVHVGWHFTNSSYYPQPYPRLQGVHFLTTPSNINTTAKGSEFYIDDFCISSYACPAPDSLQLVNNGCTYAIVNWKPGVEGNTTLVEYDTTGFTPGTGTVMQTFNDQDTLAGLSPGGSYDVYVSEVCGRDTTTLGPLTINLISHASADFSFTLANANPNNRKVTFDGSASVGADSLYWDFGDSTSSNGVSPFHFYNANGTYTVTLIVTSSDCGSDTITKTVTITGIGLVENTLDNSLDLYPNPATDQLSIDFNGAGSSHASIRILDMSGKLLYQKEADDVNGKYHTTIDLSRWASGVYMVEVKSGGLTAHRRVTKH